MPPFAGHAPRFEGGMAYERFLVAAGEGHGHDRVAACDAAELQARHAMLDLLVADSELRPEVIAAAGGPSRLASALDRLADTDGRRAVRTQEVFQPKGRLCWLELRWLLPRHLDVAVRRALGSRPEEASVGSALQDALRASTGEGDQPAGEAEPTSGVTDPAEAPPLSLGPPTAYAAIVAVYAGWFVRVLLAEVCDGQRLAFVGAPRGGEARWLWLAREGHGWRITRDERIVGEAWPTAPSDCR